MNKKEKKNSIFVRTMPIVELYYSKCQIYLAFGTFDDSGFLVFDVLNTKNLAFSTPVANALMFVLGGTYFINLICLL